MKKRSKLILSLLPPLAVGGAAGLFTRQGVTTWYPTLQKPSWNPPNWVFAPVWTFLYVLMGIALYIVWAAPKPKSEKQLAIWLWAAQLLCNFLWSFLFFDRHWIAAALVDISVLWLLILLTILAFARINKTAAWLLVPYISWVTFAGFLNVALYRLNS